MRVLHVIPSVAANSGGPAQAIFPMCSALRSQGVDVLLATSDAGICDAPLPETVVSYNDVPTIFFHSQFGRSFKFSKPMSNWLKASVPDFDLVHIHAVFNHACVAASRACLANRIPYVIRPLGTLEPWSVKQKRFRKRVFWRLRGEEMLRGAVAVHYTTSAEQRSVEEQFRLNNGIVIPLGIEPEASENFSHHDDVLTSFSELNGHPYVLVLSRLHPKKALDVLIDAFVDATADPELHKWRLVIAGDGEPEYVRSLRERVHQSDKQQQILFSGWLTGDAKWNALSNASLLALPSYQENFGLCVLEALTCGVPVLVSQHVNLADDIERAGAGWVSDVRTRQLAAALTSALGDDGERQRRGIAGKVFSKQFTAERTGTELIRLYSAICSSHANEYSTVTC
jgi:glycosyltransferase involved in cell wall biosynthesis